MNIQANEVQRIGKHRYRFIDSGTHLAVLTHCGVRVWN